MVNVITQLAEAYDILRTTFVTVPSGVLQVIHTGLQHLQVANADAASIDAFLEADHRRGFEVGDKCFSRFSMVQTPLSSTLYCVLTMHHALYDGWTIAMLLRDLYDLLHDERPLVPRPSFRRVVDYIQAQDQRDTETFWRGYLHGLNVHLIALGTVQHGVASPGSAATRRPTSIALQLNEIQEASKRVGLTVAEFTRLVWALTLRKYTRHNDVIFGQVLSNRNLPVSDVARILGPLISTVPCRVTFDESSNSLRGAIASIQAQRGALVGHSYASLVDMKRWSGVVDNVFDTVLAFQQLPAIWDFGPGSSTYDIAAPHAVEHTLEVTIWPNETHLTVLARHDPTRLTDEHARQILEEMRHTSGQVYALSHDLDDDSSMLWDVSDTQRGWIDASSFGPQTILPYELVHHAFEARATSHPTTPAIEFEGTCLTYGQLNDRANTLAAQLYCMGVGVGHRVGVVMERCLEFPTALLAALKVGASMMPLDAAFPVSRLLYMLADANAFVVVTTDKHRHLVESMTLGIPFVCISSSSTDAASSQPIKASRCNATRTDEAYVVYTSGSSGTPKGVPVTHAAAVNVSHFRSVETGFVPGHRVMQFMAIGFDGFQWDLWKCLSNGATLVLRSHEVLHELKSIHAFTCTPTALFLLGHPSEFPSLRVVSVAGETCPLVLKDLWAPYVRFMNLYGPSECAIMTHYAELQPGDPITIGRPLENVHSYILDSNQRPVPVGVVGELCLGGVCVSPGYINLPHQTNERFIPDPFVQGGVMFRTGDLGRLLLDGNFELLGREDSQVKLKGYRIELDEVAGAMMQHPDVVSAAVIVKDKSHLVGYFTPASVAIEKLQQVVAAHLPVYMVPAVWVGLDVMPQNSNGKTDKNALQAMEVEVQVEALETESERRMAKIWAQVLGVNVNDIGRRTSFFSI
ncbi:hypothetical protein DYB30_013184, partial [Aphanomyces astaci]